MHKQCGFNFGTKSFGPNYTTRGLLTCRQADKGDVQ